MTKVQLEDAIRLGAVTSRETAWIDKLDREIKCHLRMGHWKIAIELQHELLTFAQQRVTNETKSIKFI